MRAILTIALISLLLVSACAKQGTQLPSADQLDSVDVDTTDQEVLDENTADVDADLGALSGDAAAEVESTVSDEEMAQIAGDMQSIDEESQGLDPSQFDVDTNV